MDGEIIDNGSGQPTGSTHGIASTVNPNGVQPTEPVKTEPVKEEPKQEPVKTEPAKPAVDTSKPLNMDTPPIVPVQYEPTGNPTHDIINEYVGSKGIGPDSEEYKAALKGDFGPLEAKFKSLGDQAKGYERYLNAAKQEFSNAQAAHQAKHGETIKQCHQMAEAVGGWDSLSQWVREHADPSELAEINEALAAGGLAARQVTDYLVKLRQANPDKAAPAPGKSPVKDNASTVRDATGGALNPVQFQQEIRRLADKHGNAYVHTPEYQDAVRRRNAFRG